MTERPLHRDQLAPGVEQRAAAAPSRRRRRRRPRPRRLGVRARDDDPRAERPLSRGADLDAAWERGLAAFRETTNPAC